LTEGFTEIGSGAAHVWDEEFTLLVDKVGDRVVRLEAVDDRLRFGRDTLGFAVIPVESLALGPPLSNGEGVLWKAVGEERQEWFELSQREVPRDDEELELMVVLVEATGLVAADKSGTSDPYCTLEMPGTKTQNAQKFKSKTQKKTLDPVWGEPFIFSLGKYANVFPKVGKDTRKANLHDAAYTTLEQLKQPDVFRNIAQLGVAAMQPILDAERKKEDDDKQREEDAASPATLYIRVIQAKALIAADAGGTSDPYVRVHVGSDVANGKKTQVIKKTVNPAWEEELVVPIRANQRGDVLTVAVFDRDVIGKDDPLGKLMIPLSSLALLYGRAHDAHMLPATWHALDEEEGIHNAGHVQLGLELVKRVAGAAPPPKEGAPLAAGTKGEIYAQTITLKLWDYDVGVFGSDDFLGQVVVPVNLLAPNEKLDKWFDVQPRASLVTAQAHDIVTGQVHLKLKCRYKKDPSRPPSSPPRAPARVLLQLQRVKEVRELRPTEVIVTLVGAKNVHRRLDTDVQPNVLAVVAMDGRKLLADVVVGKVDPMWDREFCFDTIRLWSTIHVTLFDALSKQQRRFLGKIEFDPSTLKVGKVREETMELVKGHRRLPDTSASVHKHLQIIVRLLEAKDLLAADRSGTSDPYATLQVDAQKQQSRVQKKTLKPKWRETFRFLLGLYPASRSEQERTKNRSLWKKARKKNTSKHNLQKKDRGDRGEWSGTRPGSAGSAFSTNTMVTSFSEILKGARTMLTVSIWDHDVGPNADDFLGCVVLPLDWVSEGDEFEDWFELRPGEDKTQVSGLVKLALKVTEK